MRKRHLGIFAFFSFLFSFLMMNIVEDDGAGGGDDDVFDKDLDDEGGDDKASDDKKAPASEDKKTPSISDEDKTLLEELKQERALNDITKEMKAQYGDSFDMDAIKAKLQEMEKEKPGSGQALFNKVGIENTFLKHFANKGSDDEFDAGGGRGSKSLSTDELIGKINSGEASDSERAAFYAKYA